MKLRDIINSVDRSDRNSTYLDEEDLIWRGLGCQDMPIPYRNDQLLERVKKYWIGPWMCTDTWVGYAAYYFDDKPVAVSYQSARKSDENIQFLSQAAADSVHAFLLTLIDPQYSPEIISDEHLDEDLGPGVQVCYGSQYLTNEVLYEAFDDGVTSYKPAKIVKKYWTHNQRDEYDKHDYIDILVQGETVIRQVRHDEVYTPWNLSPFATFDIKAGIAATFPDIAANRGA